MAPRYESQFNFFSEIPNLVQQKDALPLNNQAVIRNSGISSQCDQSRIFLQRSDSQQQCQQPSQRKMQDQELQRSQKLVINIQGNQDIEISDSVSKQVDVWKSPPGKERNKPNKTEILDDRRVFMIKLRFCFKKYQHNFDKYRKSNFIRFPRKVDQEDILAVQSWINELYDNLYQEVSTKNHLFRQLSFRPGLNSPFEAYLHQLYHMLNVLQGNKMLQGYQKCQPPKKLVRIISVVENQNNEKSISDEIQFECDDQSEQQEIWRTLVNQTYLVIDDRELIANEQRHNDFFLAESFGLIQDSQKVGQQPTDWFLDRISQTPL